jgi:hypothetical protein
MNSNTPFVPLSLA